MTENNSTYKLKRLTVLIVVWEALFWLGFYLLVLSANSFFSSPSQLFAFTEPDQLQWLWGVVIIVGFFLYNTFKNEQIYLKAGEKIRTTIFKPITTKRAFVSYLLFRNAFVFLVIAMAQPSFGTKKVAGTIQSMELVICLDISNSMNTQDILPDKSRLEIPKRAINELINKLGGEKIGISIFANDAYTQLPLTLDYYAAKMYVNDIETNMISSQGTNIKNALENAYSLFSENKKIAKAVILLTDGENQEDNPSEILNKYKEEEIELAVLGIGTRKGGLVPLDPNAPELGYKRTATGTAVHSKLNPNFINKIAQEADGIAVVSEGPFPDLRGLLKEITKMKRVKTEGMDFDVKEQRYQIPLAIAILCFIAYILWTGTYSNKLRHT